MIIYDNTWLPLLNTIFTIELSVRSDKSTHIMPGRKRFYSKVISGIKIAGDQVRVGMKNK